MAKQRWDPERYARNASFVAELGAPVLDLLELRPGERVLDLGCGDGALTQRIAEQGCRVLGVDASPEQVEAARRRGLEAQVGDAAALGFAAEFDAVFSNAALHWVPDAAAVIDGVWRALRPGGRFAGEFGGRGNVERIVEALLAGLERRGVDGHAHHPWYFPDPAAYGDLLRRRGFEVGDIELFERPTPIPGDLVSWLETFAEPFAAPLPAAERDAFLREVQEALRPALCDARGGWHVDYVRLRFSARKPPP